MVAVVSNKGSFFKGLLNYLYDGRLKDRGSKDKKSEVIIFSDNIRIPYGPEDSIGRKRMLDDFIDQAEGHRNYGDNKTKYVGEHILSFRPEEVKGLGKDKIKEICEQYVKDSGFDNTQYLAVSHGDTDVFHVHIVFNRCQNDGTLYPCWKEKLKAAERAVAISMKYGLSLVGNQSKLADTKGVLEARAKHSDILDLVQEPLFQNVRNLLHLQKKCEASNTTFSVQDDTVKIGNESYSKLDLETVFFINRQTNVKNAQKTDFTSKNIRYNREKKSTMPDYQRKKNKIENNRDEWINDKIERKPESELLTESTNRIEDFLEFNHKKAWGKSDESENKYFKRRKKK
jgi:hypothetical protein